MDIKNLPRAGSGFKVRGTAGSFSRKLKSAARRGAKHLEPYAEDITDVVSGYGTYIRRGGLSRKQRVSAYNKIKGKIGSMSSQSRRDIKKILGNLGGQTERVEKRAEKRVEKDDNNLAKSKGGIFSNILGRKKDTGNLTETQKRRNIVESRRSAGEQRAGYVASKVRYAGQTIETRSRIGAGEVAGGVRGTAKDSLGVKKGPTGFAGREKLNNIPSGPPPKPSGGARPIGL